MMMHSHIGHLIGKLGGVRGTYTADGRTRHQFSLRGSVSLHRLLILTGTANASADRPRQLSATSALEECARLRSAFAGAVLNQAWRTNRLHSGLNCTRHRVWLVAGSAVDLATHRP